MYVNKRIKQLYLFKYYNYKAILVHSDFSAVFYMWYIRQTNCVFNLTLYTMSIVAAK